MLLTQLFAVQNRVSELPSKVDPLESLKKAQMEGLQLMQTLEAKGESVLEAAADARIRPVPAVHPSQVGLAPDEL